MPRKLLHDLCTCDVPNADRLIIARRDDTAAVGGKGDRTNVAGMPFEVLYLRSGLGVPKPKGSIVACRNDPVPVGEKATLLTVCS